jgi:hypothetical protein
MTHEFSDGEPEKIHSIDQIDKDLLRRVSVRVDKGPMTPNPTEWGWELEEDYIGIPKNANAMYRSDEPRNTIQVREYDDYYLIQLDHVHPLENPVAHYKFDISPGQKAGIAIAAIVVGAAIFGALS